MEDCQVSDSKKKTSFLKRLALVVLGTFAAFVIGIQFMPVDRSNPPVTQVVDAPPEAMTILKRACFDCHSNETVWPWYSKVAPVSWIVAGHVEMGREHVNFSMWDEYDEEDIADIMEELWEEVEKGHMPLPNYVNMHPEAVLSEADLAILKAWSETGG
jgi:hypothetical protein